MKTIEIRDKSTDELYAILDDTRRDLFTLLNQMKIEKRPVDKNQFNQKKKIVARILTIIREREVANAGA